MPRQTFAELGEDLVFYRRLYWQMLRRSEKYKNSVLVFLKAIRRYRDKRNASHARFLRRRQHLSEANQLDAAASLFRKQLDVKGHKSVLRSYMDLKSYGLRLLQAGVKVLATLGQAEYQAVQNQTMEIIRPGLKDSVSLIDDWRKYSEDIQAGRRPRESRAVVAELPGFARQWSLRFPMPPSFPICVESAFLPGPIFPIRYSTTQRSLRLTIRKVLPKRLLLACIDGAIHHFVPHTQDWKTVARKKRPKGLILEEVRIEDHGKQMVLVIPLTERSVRLDKGQLIRFIGRKLTGCPRLRLRKDELQEMLKIVDALKQRPRPTRTSITQKYFPGPIFIYCVRNRERRFKQLLAALGL